MQLPARREEGRFKRERQRPVIDLMIAWTINARREAWRQIRLFPDSLAAGQPFDIETLACLILVGKAELLRIVPIGRDDQGAFIAVSN